jgi:adenylate cyclase
MASGPAKVYRAGEVVPCGNGRRAGAGARGAVRLLCPRLFARLGERALALNPNYDLVVVQQGELLTWLGQPDEGIDWIKKAMRLNAYHPERFWGHLGRACYCAEKYAEAAEAFSRITRPDHTHHAFLAATFAQMGNAVAAAAHAAEVLKREPTFSVADYLTTQHYKREADRLRHETGLLKAGLPA